MTLRIREWICLMICAVAVSGEDWPNWRGPDRNGISKEKGWASHWPAEGPKVLWKAKLGTGFSSFSVAKGRLVAMGNENNTDTVFSFDAESGKPLWKQSYPADQGSRFFEGGPTATPAIDGDEVFTLSRWGDLFCFDAASGKIIWQNNVQKATGIRIPGWGFSGSPLVQGNIIVLTIGEAGMGLEKTTGKILWKSANKDCGYSTPLPLHQGGKDLVILSSSQAYLAVEIQTGAEAWRVRWLTEYGINAADPIPSEDKLFISSGYGKGCALLKLTQPEPEILWKSKVIRNQINSSVLVGNYLFGIDGDVDNAALKCIEFATGKEQWQERSIGAGALMAADGKLIVLGDKGELLIAPATAEAFKPSARAQVLGGKCWTVPVLANGRIYCRNSRGDMVCLDAR